MHTFFTPGDRQAVAAALLLSLLLFFAPLLLLPAAGPETPPPPPGGSSPSADSSRTVRLLEQDGSVTELTMADYLWGVVAAEMPASFHGEALKAQACAARTYTLIRQNAGEKKHPDADVCTDSHCCQAYITRADAQARWGLSAGACTEKITAAVAETDSLGILYDGKPIQALFFSSAAGKTVDAVEVWGNPVDYLKSVDSPEGEEVPNYRSQAVFTAEEVKAAVLAQYPGADLSGPPEAWFGAPVPGVGGGVAELTVGGLTLTGGQVRKLFGLRSASFTVDLAGDSFTFSVVGHGHGVGMSQYGANAMAAQGKGFREILTWYYSGVEVAPLW